MFGEFTSLQNLPRTSATLQDTAIMPVSDSHANPADLDGHLRLKDLSRWIIDVVGDYRLGKTVSDLEDSYRLGSAPKVAHDLVLERGNHREHQLCL